MQTVDPYESMALFQKAQDPSKQIVMRQFKRSDVAAVDKLIELAGESRDVVKTDADWRLVEIIMQFFIERWPQEFKDFYDAIPDIRKLKNDKGYSKTKEIKHVGSLPIRFMKLVQVIFPFQQFDKKFVYKLVRRIPLLAVGV